MSLKKDDGVTQADRGGSFRAGILNKGLFGNGRFGFYLGWQPSDPSHINFGFGITFDSANYFKGSGY